MKLTISLPRFVEFLDQAREFDAKHPGLSRSEWLVDNFRFDDDEAELAPLPQLPNIGALRWKCLAGRSRK